MIVPIVSSYLHYYRIFRRYTGGSMHVLELLAIVSANLDGLGIAAVVPLLAGTLSPSAQPVFGLGPTAALFAVIVLFVLKGAFRYAFAVYQAKVNHRLANDLTRALTDALGRLDYPESLKLDRGHLTNVMTHEVTRTAASFLGLSSLVPAAANIAVATIIALYLKWQLTLATLVLALVLLLAARSSSRIARQYSQELTRRYSALFGLVIQLIESLKYLRATARYPTIAARIATEADAISETAVKNTEAGQLIGAFIEPLAITFLAGVLHYESRAGTADLPALSALALLAYRIMNQVVVFQAAYQKFSGSVGSVDAVTGMLARLERAPAGSGKERAKGEALALTGVGFSHGDREVLADVTLSIRKNERVAFVGESGAGKSTLVNILVGLFAPTRGTYAVDGVDSRALDWDDLRARIGFVPQDATLFDDSLEANIRFWEPADAARLARAVQGAHLDAVVTQSDRAKALSGGERQRVALARELWKEPTLLVLDEATSALDAESEDVILKTLDELSGKVTIIMVAHRLYSVRGCDRIFVLSSGRVVEQGTFAELSAREGSQFKRLLELQS